ncbi:MAG: pyroglutamyl-peptidase I, partial [Clostridiaceae bacterium]|nr:pyroglutamyl-peptidase I [Clostridiaceae bacterium]
MKILMTGFDPFGGDKINPSFEAVKGLEDVIAGVEVVKLEIPTVFNKSIIELEKAI